ncbi:hypothetical protein MAH1_19270 [Sessilibacter sp. MAH1]
MSPWYLYDELIKEASNILSPNTNKLLSVDNPAIIKEICLGINWSYLSAGFLTEKYDLRVSNFFSQQGIFFSPKNIARTLPWSGSLINSPIQQYFTSIKSWEWAEATVGALAINTVINSRSTLLNNAENIDGSQSIPGNLTVFKHFLPQLHGKQVSVIGRYPGLEILLKQNDINPELWTIIEKNPQGNDYPDVAAYYYLSESDWVFITASSIVNKTLPMLLQCCKDANVVLMGPSLPWSTVWKKLGVNYLAGVEVLSLSGLKEVVMQAGGTQLFEGAVVYKILAL